jgi:hypothetical protein
MARLRLGIILFIISWLPIAPLLVAVVHDNELLTNQHASSEVRLVTWAVQIVIGFIGLWLVGKLALAEVRQAGLKHAPRRMWHLFLHGKSD